ncbi:MAG: DedA family protein [Candidatus Omnitrophica bacterium]|nr:DedA family protein [Candidatus Omnitrophota bacterium]
MTLLRRLYDWSLKKAATKHAERFLFWIAFAESSFFPIPPDILLIVMVLSTRTKWFHYFLICLVGSVLGGIAGYLIGFGIWEVVHSWFFTYAFSEATFEKVRHLYMRYDFWVVCIAAFTPIPYKVFTIAAGVASIDVIRFVLASVCGRGGRFIVVSFLLYRYGASVRRWIEKYFNLLTLVFTILLLGGFWAIKHFVRT